MVCDNLSCQFLLPRRADRHAARFTAQPDGLRAAIRTCIVPYFQSSRVWIKEASCPYVVVASLAHPLHERMCRNRSWSSYCRIRSPP
jgi:hypothetical protein